MFSFQYFPFIFKPGNIDVIKENWAAKKKKKKKQYLIFAIYSVDFVTENITFFALSDKTRIYVLLGAW